MKIIKILGVILCLSLASSNIYASESDLIPIELQDIKSQALNGNIEAQVKLGDFFLDGRDSDIPYSIPTELLHSIKWYELAAKQGDKPTQFKVGFLALLHASTNDDDSMMEKSLYWLAVSNARGIEKAEELYLEVSAVLKEKYPDKYSIQRAKADEYIELYAKPYMKEKAEQESAE